MITIIIMMVIIIMIIVIGWSNKSLPGYRNNDNDSNIVINIHMLYNSIYDRSVA